MLRAAVTAVRGMSPTPIHPLSGVYAGVILEQRGDLNAMDQKVWFWRVARQPDLVKIRWLGPAQIVMKECKNDGTQLIRCAAHHVSADVKSLDHALADTQSALNTASRSRGVTRFYDLHQANLAEVEDGEHGDATAIE